MSLRFLKAKPKLTLSKNNRIRTVQNNSESNKNDSSNLDFVSNIEIQSEVKDQEIINIKTQENVKEGTSTNQKIISLLNIHKNEENSLLASIKIEETKLDNQNVNLKKCNDDNKNQSEKEINVKINTKESKEKSLDHIRKENENISTPDKIELKSISLDQSENTNINKSNEKLINNESKITLVPKSLANKFRFLKVKPKINLQNKRSNQISKEENKELINNKQPILNLDDNSEKSKNDNADVVTSTKDAECRIEIKPEPKEIKYSNKNNLVNTNIPSVSKTSNDNLSNSNNLDKSNEIHDQSHQIDKNLENEMNNFIQYDLKSNYSNQQTSQSLLDSSSQIIEQNQTPIDTNVCSTNINQNLNISLESPDKEMKNISETNIINKPKTLASFIKLLEMESIRNDTLDSTEQPNYEMSNDKCQTEQNENKEQSQTETKNKDDISFNNDEVQNNSIIESENNVKTYDKLKNKSIKSDDKKTKTRKKNPKETKKKNKQNIKTIKNENMLTENNIDSIPIVINQSGEFQPDDFILINLDDHSYSKSNENIIEQNQTINIQSNIEIEKSIVKTRKKLNNKKEVSKTNGQENTSTKVKRKTKSKNSSMTDNIKTLNSFQRALLAVENGENEQNESEISISEPSDNELDTIDINITEAHRDPLDGTNESTTVLDISCVFGNNKLSTLSGLSLVTKIIKEESPEQDDFSYYENFHEEKPTSYPNSSHTSYPWFYQHSSTVTQNTIINSNAFDDAGVNTYEAKPYVTNESNSYQDNLYGEFIDKEEHKYLINGVPDVWNQDQKNENEHLEKCEEIFLLEDNIILFEDESKEETKPDYKLAQEPTPKKRKNVTFNIEDKEKKKKIKTETKECDKNSKKRNSKPLVKSDFKYDYDSSGSDVTDIEERDYIMGKRKYFSKKRSENIFQKRQSETLKKIKSDASWKENLTVNDLIFYNPKCNPMNNPPEEVKRPIEEEIEEDDDEEEVDNPAPVPQLKIVNNKLVLDVNSLTIEETGLKKNKMKLENSKAIVESMHTVKRFDNIYRKRSQTSKRGSFEWSYDDTLIFYRAVNTLGTDFSGMVSLFPNKTRNEIKRKFKHEEKKNAGLLYRALTDHKFFDVEALKDELEEDKKRMEKIKRKTRIKQTKEKERKKKERTKTPNRRTSVYGKLINEPSNSKKEHEYVPPHPEMSKIFQILTKQSAE